MMVYYGLVDDSVTNLEEVYGFLMNALKLIPEDNPYRGPKSYDNKYLSYKNSFTGEIDSFFGEESISDNGKEIYRARYMGGFIDTR